MSSGTPVQQPGTLSQGSADFLQIASSIAEPDTGAAFSTVDSNLSDLAMGYPLVGGPVTASAAVTAATPFNDVVTSGNFSINLEFDAAAAGADSSFISSVEQAASVIVADLHVKNAVTLNLQIQWGKMASLPMPGQLNRSRATTRAMRRCGLC